MIDLFDIQAGILGVHVGQRRPASCQELLETMERLNIARALVRVAPAELETDIVFANAKLYQATSQHDQLVPCPAVAPSTGGDLPSEADQVAEAVSSGAGAAWIRTKIDYWSIAEWVSDRLFEVLSEKHLPVCVCLEMLSLTDVAELAKRFGELRIILAEVGYRDQRMLLPLLERFENIYLSIGRSYTVHGGIEQFVDRLGAGRLLFGTGFPDSEPMSAVMQLLYADIPELAKQQIGFQNAERLIGGIQR